MSTHPENVRFSRHAIVELANDDLTPTDALNVLKSLDAKIHQEGKWENRNYRYRLETSNLRLQIS
jgi:hypothetical protein